MKLFLFIILVKYTHGKVLQIVEKTDNFGILEAARDLFDTITNSFEWAHSSNKILEANY